METTLIFYRLQGRSTCFLTSVRRKKKEEVHNNMVRESSIKYGESTTALIIPTTYLIARQFG